MAWIEIHQELPEHPKTDALMDAIGCERPAAVGHVIMSLLWALRYAHDGVIIPKRLGAIARGAGWIADPDRFASAMVEAGWWDQWGDGWKLHDWDVYAGMLLAKREKDAARKRGDRGAEHPKHVQRTSTGRPSDARMDGAGTNKHDKHDKPLHVSTDVDAPAKVASLTLGPPAPDDGVLDVVIPEAKAEGVTQEITRRRSRKPSSYSEAFDAFWLGYLGGGSKKDAGAEWVAAGLDDDHDKRAMVLRAYEAQVADRAKKPANEFYAEWPHAERWLKKERWMDKLKYGGPVAAGAGLPVPGEIRDRPWLAVWMEKRGTQPEPLTVMNLATALGADPYRAVELYREKGLAAAGDWAWDSRKTG
jgi:hypothetical protein